MSHPLHLRGLCGEYVTAILARSTSFSIRRSDQIDIMIHVGCVGKNKAVWPCCEAIDHVLQVAVGGPVKMRCAIGYTTSPPLDPRRALR